jgi:hypothetical protein
MSSFLDKKGENMIDMLSNIGNIRSRTGKVAAIAFLILYFLSPSFAQDKKVEITKFVQESQKIDQSHESMTVVWWIPDDFWRVNFEQDPRATKAQYEELVEVIKPYTVFAVVDGKIGNFGGITFTPESSIRSSIQLIDAQKKSYPPFSMQKIDADMKNFLSMMKPVLANMLGPMGQNMHFFLFPAKNSAGKDIAHATKEGTFSVKFDNRDYKFRTPLGSLLPQKVCPVDGEKMSGAWKFCPWHGVELK